MPLEGNLSAFGDQTNQFCSGHFGELKLQKKSGEKKMANKMKRHEVNAADQSHVLYEAADAKKQQPGQQLVHEASQWVGGHKGVGAGRWLGVWVAQGQGVVKNHATEHDKQTQRSASWLPFCHVPRPGNPASRTPGQLQKCCSCSMGQYPPVWGTHFATRSLVLRDNKMKTLNAQVKE